MTGLREAKAALREAVLRRRDALTDPDRSALSRAIVGEVLGLPAYREAGTVLAYASFGSEPGTEGFLLRALDDGKTLLLPRVERDRGGLRLYGVEDPARDLEPGAWGIREPRRDLQTPADAGLVDFALVPGVAFDRRGRRLGYGGGFYDALISHGLAPGTALISAAFECQMVDEIPTGEHDVPVDLVITEANRYPARTAAP